MDVQVGCLVSVIACFFLLSVTAGPLKQGEQHGPGVNHNTVLKPEKQPHPQEEHQVPGAQPRYDSDGYHPLHQFRDSRGDFIGSGRRYDWRAMGEQELERSLEIFDNPIVKKAKNIVFFIGDGMGITTTTAARVHHAQSRQLEGDDILLAWDKMPHSGLSMTYSANALTTDSASTATALLSGEKTNYGIVGLNQDAVWSDCESATGNSVKSSLHKAMESGRAAGIVTTTSVTHATPAAAYAHCPDRLWEANAEDDCQDIASQLIDNDVNQDIRVVMGGGRRNFTPLSPGQPDPETGLPGRRLDGRNLMEEWEENMANNGLEPEQYALVIDQDGFDNIDPAVVTHVLGLFEHGHMNWEADRLNDTLGEPSLAEMVEKSIRILEQDDDGFFLYVEGGRIDHGHHGTNAYRALEDAVALSKAVDVAREMTEEEETLIIVTADHSHVFSIAGYQDISTDIYGYDEVRMNAMDSLPYATLSYANGPGYLNHRTENGSLSSERPRKDISEFGDELGTVDYQQDAGVPELAESHGGEEVAIYASGPMSHLIHSTHQQSYIAHVVDYAACLQENNNGAHCSSATVRGGSTRQVAAPLSGLAAILTILAVTVCE